MQVSTQQLSLDHGVTLDNYVATLTALPGIGDWTAQYIAMRALGHPDAFPAGDLILRRAAVVANLQPEALKPAAMVALTEKQLRTQAENWRPWRAYAVMHLWRSYSAATST